MKVWQLICMAVAVSGFTAAIVTSTPERQGLPSVEIVTFCAERVVNIMVGRDPATGASCAITVFDDGTHSAMFCDESKST